MTECEQHLQLKSKRTPQHCRVLSTLSIVLFCYVFIIANDCYYFSFALD